MPRSWSRRAFGNPLPRAVGPDSAQLIGLLTGDDPLPTVRFLTV